MSMITQLGLNVSSVTANDLQKYLISWKNLGKIFNFLKKSWQSWKISKILKSLNIFETLKKYEVSWKNWKKSRAKKPLWNFNFLHQISMKKISSILGKSFSVIPWLHKPTVVCSCTNFKMSGSVPRSPPL